MSLTRGIGQTPNLLIKNHERQRGEYGGHPERAAGYVGGRADRGKVSEGLGQQQWPDNHGNAVDAGHNTLQFALPVSGHLIGQNTGNDSLELLDELFEIEGRLFLDLE